MERVRQLLACGRVGDSGAVVGDADMDWWMGGAAGGVARFVFPAPGRELGDEGANGGNGMETGPLHMCLQLRQRRGALP